MKAASPPLAYWIFPAAGNVSLRVILTDQTRPVVPYPYRFATPYSTEADSAGLKALAGDMLWDWTRSSDVVLFYAAELAEELGDGLKRYASAALSGDQLQEWLDIATEARITEARELIERRNKK